MYSLPKLLLALGLSISVTGCAVIAVADAAASLAVGVVKTTAKVAGAAVDAVIPDGEDKKAEPQTAPASTPAP